MPSRDATAGRRKATACGLAACAAMRRGGCSLRADNRRDSLGLFFWFFSLPAWLTPVGSKQRQEQNLICGRDGQGALHQQARTFIIPVLELMFENNVTAQGIAKHSLIAHLFRANRCISCSRLPVARVRPSSFAFLQFGRSSGAVSRQRHQRTWKVPLNSILAKAGGRPRMGRVTAT
jgi:hypothetical protein